MSAKSVIPRHISIIMDGNGRWAQQRKLPRIAGHRKGADVIKSIVSYCDSIGVEFLTLYTFSTENWKRPKEEINFLMQLLQSYLEKEIKGMQKNNTRFMTIGEIGALPKKAQQVIAKAKEKTKDNTGVTLILALNYGSRAEIVRAALSMCEDIRSGNVLPENISEDVFSQYLFTQGIPDPELMIRTSGEMRLSNFLLWQLSYTELYVSEKLWPDFDKEELKKAISVFQQRKRRFGGI